MGHADMLTTEIAKRLERPESGSAIHYDHAKGDDPGKVVRGFGLRVTAAGARSFVLNYRAAGQERRLTIGTFPDWSVSRARAEARELRVRVDRGEDPLADRVALRVAPTVRQLADRYCEEHLPKKRPSSARDDRAMLRLWVLPAIGTKKVAAIRPADIEALHTKVTRSGKNIQANRVVSLLSKMFALAVKWEYRADNPCRGAVDRNPETKRKRYLSTAEIARLSLALGECKDRQSANAIRLLLLTGARRGEVEGATWGQIDIATGTWTKPASETKQKRDHTVPLSAAALQLLSEMGPADSQEYLFPVGDGHLNLGHAWEWVRKEAKLEGVHLHDLRHSAASILVSAGASLPLIGALLGHSSVMTTARYAHLSDDAQRDAVNRLGAVVSGNTGDTGDVVPLAKVRR
jgi:integrase